MVWRGGQECSFPSVCLSIGCSGSSGHKRIGVVGFVLPMPVGIVSKAGKWKTAAEYGIK